MAPTDGAAAVNPLDPVVVATNHGTLESVTMTNDEGRVVEGIFTPDRLSWKPGVPLGYGRTYTLTVSAVGDQSARSEKTSTFTTVTPRQPDHAVLRHHRRELARRRRSHSASAP